MDPHVPRPTPEPPHPFDPRNFDPRNVLRDFPPLPDLPHLPTLPTFPNFRALPAHLYSDHASSSPFRRLFLALVTLWLLVATNPSYPSFFSYLASRRATGPSFRLAVPTVLSPLQKVFNPPPTPDSTLITYDGLDCGLFTLVRFQPPAPVESTSKPSISLPPSFIHVYVYLGICNTWLPLPNPLVIVDGAAVLGAAGHLRDAARILAKSGLAPGVLPSRPWEGLVASFAAAGAFWYILPGAAARHLTLTWENARGAGRWWTLVLFHLSHGGSFLRLSRTVAACNYLAPMLLQHDVLSLSGLYGVVLTAAAMSSALGILVLARRSVASADSPRTRLEIDGGGGCVYAMLVAACLDAQSGRPGATNSWRVRPFELLMLNIAFDAWFLAGQKRIADYTAHTGAALGAWIYIAVNR